MINLAATNLRIEGSLLRAICGWAIFHDVVTYVRRSHSANFVRNALTVSLKWGSLHKAAVDNESFGITCKLMDTFPELQTDFSIVSSSIDYENLRLLKELLVNRGAVSSQVAQWAMLAFAMTKSKAAAVQLLLGPGGIDPQLL